MMYKVVAIALYKNAIRDSVLAIGVHKILFFLKGVNPKDGTKVGLEKPFFLMFA